MRPSAHSNVGLFAWVYSAARKANAALLPGGVRLPRQGAKGEGEILARRGEPSRISGRQKRINARFARSPRWERGEAAAALALKLPTTCRTKLLRGPGSAALLFCRRFAR